TLPSALKTIYREAFMGSGLTSISIPNTVTTIADCVFADTKLASVTIPVKVTWIDGSTFADCPKLATVVVKGATTIAEGAFMNCNAIKTITLPKSLNTIKEYAFSGSGAISTVNYEGSQSDWKKITISKTENNRLNGAKTFNYNYGASFTVTFNGGSPKTIKVVNGKKISSAAKTLPTVKKAGYLFKGWYTAKSGGTKVTLNTVVTKSVTVYPQWTAVSVGKPTISKVVAKSQKLTVNFKPVSGVAGYELRYSLKSNMSGSKPVNLKKTAKSGVTPKLAKKKYYVQVWAYKLDSAGKKVYGKSKMVTKVIQ
ncbi:MAG: leucine-rich repeat protein, partial [Lachnospiraceae bacterium]|nr:leucine-rich repeat protein [Lachnospiraceae bacterium]